MCSDRNCCCRALHDRRAPFFSPARTPSTSRHRRRASWLTSARTRSDGRTWWFLVTSLAAYRLKDETGSRALVLVAGIVLTSLVLLVFGVQTLRTAPQTFVAMVAILLLALALDLVWSALRRRRAGSVAGSSGHAGSSARDDVPPPPAP